MINKLFNDNELTISELLDEWASLSLLLPPYTTDSWTNFSHHSSSLSFVVSLKLFVISRAVHNCAQLPMAKLGAMAGTGIMSRPSLMRLLPVMRRTSGKPQSGYFHLNLFLVLFPLWSFSNFFLVYTGESFLVYRFPPIRFIDASIRKFWTARSNSFSFLSVAFSFWDICHGETMSYSDTIHRNCAEFHNCFCSWNFPFSALERLLCFVVVNCGNTSCRPLPKKNNSVRIWEEFNINTSSTVHICQMWCG